MRLALNADVVKQIEGPHVAAGVPLMQRAAEAVTEAVVAEARTIKKDVAGVRVLVLVGKGLNGGDGLIAASMLVQRGLAVSALVVGDDVHLGAMHSARAAGVDVLRAPGAAYDGAREVPIGELVGWSQIVVDGMLGAGARGALRGVPLDVAEAVRAAPRRPVVAIDVPSGIGVDDGTIPGVVLPADHTVTMIVAKPALHLPPAAGLVGRVTVADIGVPIDVPADVLVPEWRDAAAQIWPPTWDDDKYSRGVLGVLAGSETYPGAGMLACSAALRTGLGMVRHLTGGRAGDLAVREHPEIVGADGRVQALLLGPGVAPDTDEYSAVSDRLARALQERTPAVVDAGALEAAVPLLEQGADDELPWVLTPHAGEAARLMTALGEETSRADVLAAPAPLARELARRTGTVVLLKGARTLVAGGGPLRVASAGVPWLASAGSGDVLAGTIGALLTQSAAGAEAGGRELTRADVADAASAGALIHGMAGHRAAGPAPGRPIVAGDVVRVLPHVVGDLLAGRDPAGENSAEGSGGGLLRRFGRGRTTPGTLSR
jgi:hydroxyethylthiazole kinase-like uncharacterized protein yjeF